MNNVVEKVVFNFTSFDDITRTFKSRVIEHCNKNVAIKAANALKEHASREGCCFSQFFPKCCRLFERAVVTQNKATSFLQRFCSPPSRVDYQVRDLG